MISNNFISKTFSLGRLFIPHNYFYIPLAGVKTKDTIQLPEKPKKPLSSFFKFMQDHKVVLAKEHPEWKVTQVVKKCAEDWKTIHQTVRDKYDNEYKEEMERYSKKYLDYSMKLTDEQKEFIKELSREKRENAEKRRNRKKLKEMNKPKKPVSPYLMYLLDQSASKGKKVNELMKSMKGSWELLDESEKARYVEKSKILMEKYKEDLREWEDIMIKEGHTDMVRTKTLEEQRPATARTKAVLKKKDKHNETKDE